MQVHAFALAFRAIINIKVFCMEIFRLKLLKTILFVHGHPRGTSTGVWNTLIRKHNNIKEKNACHQYITITHFTITTVI